MRLSYRLFKLKNAVSRVVHRIIICPIKGHSVDSINYTAWSYIEGTSRHITSTFCTKCGRYYNYYEVDR